MVLTLEPLVLLGIEVDVVLDIGLGEVVELGGSIEVPARPLVGIAGDGPRRRALVLLPNPLLHLDLIQHPHLLLVLLLLVFYDQLFLSELPHVLLQHLLEPIHLLAEPPDFEVELYLDLYLLIELGVELSVAFLKLHSGDPFLLDHSLEPFDLEISYFLSLLLVLRPLS